MNEKSITRFEVTNFKKFDHLAVENIGQVNLITGDNNVGKTTLLEALLCNWQNSFWIRYLHQIVDARDIIFHAENTRTENPKIPDENFLRYIFKKINERLTCKYQFRDGTEEELGIEYKQIGEFDEKLMKYHETGYYKIYNMPEWVFFYLNGNLNEIQWVYYDDFNPRIPKKLSMPFVSFSNSFDNDLADMMHNLNYDEKQFIINSLKRWIPGIIDFDFGKVGVSKLIRIATEENKNYQPITIFGDGVQKIFRYLIEIINAASIYNKENRIMIDEIDTGIHFSKMKDEWKAIFQLSQQRGIQIFATTHSIDCIKAFVEAGEENETIKEELRLIELVEITTNAGPIKQIATTFTHSQLEAYLNSEINIRGGRL